LTMPVSDVTWSGWRERRDLQTGGRPTRRWYSSGDSECFVNATGCGGRVVGGTFGSFAIDTRRFERWVRLRWPPWES